MHSQQTRVRFAPAPARTPALAALVMSVSVVVTCGIGLRAARAASAVGAPDPQMVGRCPTEPTFEWLKMPMAGNGWDGPGTNSATVTWRVESATSDFTAGQRQAIIDALAAWAAVVQIGFVEVAIDNENAQIEFDFFTGDHSASEPQEGGDPDCPFDGAGGTLAHAGFPPGVNVDCPGVVAETFAGNVHFDEAETWEQDSSGVAGAFSLTLIACHEVGHAIGLTHSDGTSDVMRPTFGSGDRFVGLSAADIANIQAGYAAGAGGVVTLNTTGIWVDGNYGGVERGTFSEPFNTVFEGVANVPPASSGITVTIFANSYPLTFTTGQNMTLQALGGTVVIGQ